MASDPATGANEELERQHTEDIPDFKGLKFDGLRSVLLAVHIAIIAYVSLGWLIPSRTATLVYCLVLPLIALQWLFNGGSSIVNNFENIARSGQWSDRANEFEGAFFKAFFRALGIPATQAQITTVCCALMLMFWIAGLSRMILIVPASP